MTATEGGRRWTCESFQRKCYRDIQIWSQRHNMSRHNLTTGESHMRLPLLACFSVYRFSDRSEFQSIASHRNLPELEETRHRRKRKQARSGVTVKSTPLDRTGLSLSSQTEGQDFEYLSLISAVKVTPRPRPLLPLPGVCHHRGGKQAMERTRPFDSRRMIRPVIRSASFTGNRRLVGDIFIFLTLVVFCVPTALPLLAMRMGTLVCAALLLLLPVELRESHRKVSEEGEAVRHRCPGDRGQFTTGRSPWWPRHPTRRWERQRRRC